MRRGNRNVQGSVRVAEGGGEDIGGPEITARDEAKNLGLGGVIAGLGSSMDKCGDCTVAGDVGGACVQGSGLAGGTGCGFPGPSASQTQADRVDVLLKTPSRGRDGGSGATPRFD